MSEKITFRELVELIAEQSKQSQSSANSFIGELVQLIEKGLQQSGSVTISGFGKFELRWMNERPGVNPQTGEKITIPGQNKVVFKPYKALREDVNRPYAKMEAKVLSPDTTKPDPDTDSDRPQKEKIEREEKEPNDVPQDEDKAPPTPIVLTNQEETPPEDIEELLIERPVPKKKESIPGFGELKVEKFEDNLIEALFSEPKEEEEEKKAVPVSTASPTEKPGSSAVKEVQKKGAMNWTWAAAAFLVIAAIIILMLLIRPAEDPTEVASDEPTEQLAAPADQALRALPEPAEPDPKPVPDPDPGEDIPADISPFDIEPITVQQGQSLWSIAEANMGNPYLWPVIFDLNRETLDNPNLVPVFAELTVPVIQDPENMTPDQLELVALGYLSVYEWMAENNPDEARYYLWAVGVFSADVLSGTENQVNQDDWIFANTR